MDRSNEIIKLLQEKNIIRSRDIDQLGIPREYLQRLYKTNQIERIGHGLYTLTNRQIHEMSGIVEISKRAPNSVVCLISALRFHNLTTQLPFEIWIAIEGTSWKPKIDYPPISVWRFSGQSFHYGIESHEIDKTSIRVYSVAKTVADCFKFRNTIGLEVALEALRETLRENRASVDDIWLAAKTCRVANVMKPYLEAVV